MPDKQGTIVRLLASEMPVQRSVPVRRRKRITISYEGQEQQQTKESSSEPQELEDDYDPEACTETPPNGADKVLLHSCCAPCSGAMFEEMLEKGLDVTIFFYNPNIHPRKEYEIRKNENIRYALEHGVDFVDCDYDEKVYIVCVYLLRCCICALLYLVDEIMRLGCCFIYVILCTTELVHPYEWPGI